MAALCGRAVKIGWGSVARQIESGVGWSCVAPVEKPGRVRGVAQCNLSVRVSRMIRSPAAAAKWGRSGVGPLPKEQRKTEKSGVEC